MGCEDPAQSLPTRADSSVHHARSWIGSATMASGMAADTAVEGAVMAPPEADYFRPSPDFPDLTAELLDLFLVGELGGN